MKIPFVGEIQTFWFNLIPVSTYIRLKIASPACILYRIRNIVSIQYCIRVSTMSISTYTCISPINLFLDERRLGGRHHIEFTWIFFFLLLYEYNNGWKAKVGAVFQKKMFINFMLIDVFLLCFNLTTYKIIE